MKVFNYDSFISNMPDAFQKNENGNIYKLLMIEKRIYDRIQEIFQSVYDVMEIDNATGAVLDMYGERVNLKRGTSDDTQYRLRIKARMSQNFSDGSRDSVANALAYVLSTTTDKFKIKNSDETGIVYVTDMPLDVLYEAEYTPVQIVEMIEGLLPQSVHVGSATFGGSFEFGEVDEYDVSKGFADLEGTIGGEFGLLV